MAQALSQTTEKKHKVGFQHVAIFLVLSGLFFVFFHFTVIPWGVAQFVVPLFQPDGEQLEKTGFVQFDGLTWASTSKDKEPGLKGKNMEVKKDYINSDFIFDFSWTERTADVHGYVKGSTEWYAKSPLLGEHAIILQPWVGFWWLAGVFGYSNCSVYNYGYAKRHGAYGSSFRQTDK